MAAPAGTLVVIWVSESTVKAPAVPLKVTAIAPVKLAPVTVTTVPTGPLIGVKPVIIGDVTVKSLTLKAVPAALVTLILPVVAPAGTVALIWLSEPTVKVAAVPLKVVGISAMTGTCSVDFFRLTAVR